MSRVTVPILVYPNPYSLEKRKYGEVSDTQRIKRVSGSVFFLNRTFSAAPNIRYPDTSLKRGVSRPVNVLIFLDHGVPLMNARALAFRWLYYPRIYHELLSNFISHSTWTTVRVYVVLVGLRWPHQSIKSAPSKCRNVCWCINTFNFLCFEKGKEHTLLKKYHCKF